MKNLLLALVLLTCGSAYAQENPANALKVTEGDSFSYDVKSECVTHEDMGSYQQRLFTLSVSVEGYTYTRQYRSDEYARECERVKNKQSSALTADLTDIQDVLDGNIQALESEKNLLCKKKVVTLLTANGEITNILKSYRIVACPQ